MHVGVCRQKRAENGERNSKNTSSARIAMIDVTGSLSVCLSLSLARLPRVDSSFPSFFLCFDSFFLHTSLQVIFTGLVQGGVELFLATELLCADCRSRFPSTCNVCSLSRNCSCVRCAGVTAFTTKQVRIFSSSFHITHQCENPQSKLPVSTLSNSFLGGTSA